MGNSSDGLQGLLGKKSKMKMGRRIHLDTHYWFYHLIYVMLSHLSILLFNILGS